MLTMPQEADFYGNRLWLSAFLRVVGNGIPKRPIRFRRRIPVTDNIEPSTHLETTQEASTGAKTVSGEPFTKVPDVDSAGSRVREQPNSMTDTLFTAPEITNESGAGFESYEDVQIVEMLPRLKERNPTIAKTPKSKEPLKASKHRRKRRLPVNELALLRTTSSDGLPLPSVRIYLTGRYRWLELTRASRTPIVHLRRLWPSPIQLRIRAGFCHMRQLGICSISNKWPKSLRGL
jgi:hypothetical protein